MATEMTQTTLQQSQPQSNERLARLEGAYPHLATKADLQTTQTTLIKWIVATGIAILAVMLAAMFAALEFLTQLLQAGL